MKRLFIYVEGRTEETFVDRLLRQHLQSYGVKVENPLQAKKDFSQDGSRGGFTNWPAIEADLRDWFAMHPDSEADQCRFTTLLDLHQLPANVPGHPGPMASTVVDVDAIECAIQQQLGEPRFQAYLQKYEFEALLLTHPSALATVFPDCSTAIDVLERSIAGLNPEEINHGKTTHPAARIQKAIPNYGNLKASHAYWVAAEIGLDRIRSRCPRFEAWLSCWESWGMSIQPETRTPLLP